MFVFESYYIKVYKCAAPNKRRFIAVEIEPHLRSDATTLFLSPVSARQASVTFSRAHFDEIATSECVRSSRSCQTPVFTCQRDYSEATRRETRKELTAKCDERAQWGQTM